tara:strand:- start:702 stop:1511 length:810 start_codon:yes stop_codon:yes gene_type:complete
MKKILLLGCGHMGSALLTSWLKSKKYSITIIDPIKYKILKKKYSLVKIKIFKSINDYNGSYKFDFVVLATKPIDLKNALNDLNNIQLKKQTAIISIIAGKKIKVISKKFNHIKNIYRVMPNIPAIISESMNCIVANNNASKTINKEVKKLFSYSGKTIFFKHENFIDMATAVSGSGPGFIFNLIDAMEKAAIKIGFNDNTAKILVNETFRGSINLLISKNLQASELVNQVATKGGTTEAGLAVMKKNKIHKIFEDLVKTSYKKAKNQAK